jgi:hypothetical protein
MMKQWLSRQQWTGLAKQLLTSQCKHKLASDVEEFQCAVDIDINFEISNM